MRLSFDEGARQVRDLTHSALNRLSARRGPVTHRTDSGRYHRSFDGPQNWRANAPEYLLDQDEVEADPATADRLRPSSRCYEKSTPASSHSNAASRSRGGNSHWNLSVQQM